MAPHMAEPGASAIALLQQHSLAALVQREIEHRILAGELAPGAKLVEAELAAELRVSRGPVREAFRALEQAGLVKTEKNRGVFVRQVSLEEANEIYEVRAALEGLIGRLAATRARPELLVRLRAVVKKMHAVSRRTGLPAAVAAYYPLNVQFHELLLQAAGNRALSASYRRVVNELDLYRRETLARSRENIAISTRDHEAIVNAVSRGDGKLAARLLFEHVIKSRERLHRALAKPRDAAKPRRAA